MRVPLLALFITLIATAANAAPKRAPGHESLRTQCMLHAADPKNPWSLAHGIVGMGPGFTAADGRNASQVIVSDFLEKGPDGTFAFRRYGDDKTPIDPHTNLLVKNMVQVGIKDSTRFKTKVGEVTLGQLVEDVKQGFAHVPQSEAYWKDAGWTLDVLAHRLTPKNAKFKNAAGKTIDFNEVMEDALAYLELANKDIAEGMDKKLPEVPKRKQGVYAHSCGALHLVQGVFHWARHPEVKKKWGKRLDRQMDVLFYRLGSEQRQYEAALNQAPQYKLQLLTQMLKFYGHFLETTGRARKDMGFVPTVAQKRDIEKAKALLDWSTGELIEMGAYEKLDQIKASQPQVYLDLVGDACHAVNGLELWR